MTVVLKGRAHKVYTDHPDEVINALRETIIGDEPTESDDFITLQSLDIQTKPQ